MSKGEDVEAFTRIIKFQKKRYGLSIRDFFLLLVGIVILGILGLWLSSLSDGNYATILLIVTAIFFIILLISFFDLAFELGLFVENNIIVSSFVVLIAVFYTIIVALLASEFFPESDNPDLVALINLVSVLVIAFIITYFVVSGTTKSGGREEMIKKLSEIKEDIDNISISALGSKEAVTRAVKWLQFQQREDGIWGVSNPLYETSEVFRTLIELKKSLDYSWTTISQGQEEKRNLEQVYYLILEAIESATIEPIYEMLNPVLALCEIDPSHISLDKDVFNEFEDELQASSEWEFVKSLENFDETLGIQSEIPIIFPMSQIYYLKKDYQMAQKCADIFSNTFDILIRRAATRFSIQGEKEISNLLLGKMYISLKNMLRGKTPLNEQKQEGDRSSIDSSEEIDKIEEELESEFTLPDLDDDFDNSDDFDLPSPDMEVSDSPSSSNIRIEISLASIRNHLRGKQLIDGSWNGRIDTTAEVLKAVSDRESTESEFIKLGVHYLLALQEKNGSWQNDEVLTAQVVRCLGVINQSMELGSF